MMNITLFILLVLSSALAFHHPLSAKRSLRQRHFGYPKTRSTSHLKLTSDGDVDSISRSNQNNDNRRPTIIFPGGGLFFYWQAGVVVSYRVKIPFMYCKKYITAIAISRI